MDLTTVYDCTGAALTNLIIPISVQMAGYMTGQPPVPWTGQQFAAHPGAIRIDQDNTAGPASATADVFDLEPGAGTLDTLPGWVHNAWQSYLAGTRPGQRKPAVYMSESNVTPVVNRLVAAGITTGVNLWVAGTLTADQAIAKVTTASGPFPIVGWQYGFLTDHDVSIFSTTWLNDVSGKPAAPAPKPGNQAGWRWCSKCQCLTYYPHEADSYCAKGGRHDTMESHDYTLTFLS